MVKEHLTPKQEKTTATVSTLSTADLLQSTVVTTTAQFLLFRYKRVHLLSMEDTLTLQQHVRNLLLPMQSTSSTALTLTSRTVRLPLQSMAELSSVSTTPLIPKVKEHHILQKAARLYPKNTAKKHGTRYRLPENFGFTLISSFRLTEMMNGQCT